jgi:lipoprotein-anchoring transpeptidase ErfK/SrfK
MSRASRFLALFALVPAVAALVAVTGTPKSAYALPSFELVTSHGPRRITAADLGASRASGHLRVDASRMHETIARLGAEYRRTPTAGSYELVNGRVVLRPGAPGVELDEARAETLFMRALHGSRSSLRLPIRTEAALPAPTHAIVVYLEKFRLDFYTGPKLLERFPVGVGRLSFPTPPGVYHIVAKELHPSWSNPGSSWARGMPHYIPPGPYNPLGTRAMPLDRGALLIHGTPEPWTVGHPASHGCIRMKKADIEHLYDMTEVGTPVFIVP